MGFPGLAAIDRDKFWTMHRGDNTPPCFSFIEHAEFLGRSKRRRSVRPGVNDPHEKWQNDRNQARGVSTV
ncbi:MAG: hypothetical protein D6741_21370 [Planctomycetota bacterium]|nr:MAG: hypothetical protein D6741_21370 [Planctomycetota bacterium]